MSDASGAPRACVASQNFNYYVKAPRAQMQWHLNAIEHGAEGQVVHVTANVKRHSIATVESAGDECDK
jgi:hypothetical protein